MESKAAAANEAILCLGVFLRGPGTCGRKNAHAVARAGLAPDKSLLAGLRPERPDDDRLDAGWAGGVVRRGLGADSWGNAYVIAWKGLAPDITCAFCIREIKSTWEVARRLTLYTCVWAVIAGSQGPEREGKKL